MCFSILTVLQFVCAVFLSRDVFNIAIRAGVGLVMKPVSSNQCILQVFYVGWGMWQLLSNSTFLSVLAFVFCCSSVVLLYCSFFRMVDMFFQFWFVTRVCFCLIDFLTLGRGLITVTLYEKTYNLRLFSSRKIIKTFDFSTLYTSIPNSKLKANLKELVLFSLKKRMANV